MQKRVSVFIDESGDFGFIKNASKYYLITLVFHNQSVMTFLILFIKYLTIC